jgi:hypothetical protein
MILSRQPMGGAGDFRRASVPLGQTRMLVFVTINERRMVRPAPMA